MYTDSPGPQNAYDPRRMNGRPAPRAHARRRRRRGRGRFLLRTVFLALLVCGFLYGRSLLASPIPSGFSQTETGGELLGQLQALAREEPEVQEVLSHVEDYPENLLSLLVRNPETVDFVARYPQDKDRAPADAVEEVRQGEIPLLLQWDPRWGYAQYGDGLMALNGCGPTALSMVICGLTGDSAATPWAVARYAQEMGCYVDGVGTSWELMSEGCRHFGLQSRELPLDQGVMKNALEVGEPIICSVGPGDFTTSGHFIVLSGLEDGNFQVRDPNRHSTSAQLWDYDTLAGQITNLWAFSLA